MISTRADIEKFIPSLTQEEAVAVMEACKKHIYALGAIKGSMVTPLEISQPKFQTQDDWLFFGITAFLKQEGLVPSNKSIYWLERTKGFKSYKAKRPSLDAYFKKIDAQLTTVTQHRIRLAILSARCLSEFLKKREIFSVATMLSQIDKIPEALESSFPGYLKAGVMSFVLEQEGN